MLLPETRVSNSVEQPLGGELLLYDLKVNKAYSLNETSALVYRRCAGRTIFKRLRERHRGLTDEVILPALDELQ